MSCCSTRLQLVLLCFHISSFQFKISMEMNWQRQPFCLSTSCHWPQTNKMCCLHFTIVHCFAETVWKVMRCCGCTHHASRCVDQTSMLIWYILDYLWCTHWTSMSELFKCGSQLNHITCKYMFSLHSLACYFLSSIAFKLSTFYVFTFFCGLCCTYLIIYISAWNTVLFS